MFSVQCFSIRVVVSFYAEKHLTYVKSLKNSVASLLLYRLAITVAVFVHFVWLCLRKKFYW